jgi:hypothetical protein
MKPHPPRPPESPMVVRQLRVAASSFVLTSLLIISIHLLLR